jgi:hypothetical protein
MYTSQNNNGRALIDLNMAQTYIPAFFCIFKSSILIFILCNPYVPDNIPIQTTLLICLYIDRAIRSEAVFDSSAILCNILIFYIINNFRSHEDVNKVRFLSPTTIPIMCHLLQIAYCTSAVLLFMGHDILISCHNLLSASPVHGIFRTHTKPYTVIMQGILLAFLVHVPEHNLRFDTQFIVSRSFAFLLICIAWSYISGVPCMIRLLQNMKKTSSGNEKGTSHDTQPVIVQSFAQCQLMFTPILLVTDIYFYVLLIVFSVTLCSKIYTLGTIEPFSSAAYLTTANSSVGNPQPYQNSMECSPEMTRNIGRLPLLYSHAMVPPQDKGGPISIHPVPIYPLNSMKCDKGPSNIVNNYMSPVFSTSHGTSNATSTDPGVKDDTLELFRRAQQNAVTKK